MIGRERIDELMGLCCDKVRALLSKLEADGHYNSSECGEISADACKGTSAGWARLDDRVVEMNVYIMNQYQEEFLADTPGHELAHIIAWELFEDSGHGEGWKTVMGWIGQPANAHHNYDLYGYSLGPGTQMRRKYVCPKCGDHQPVTTVMHNKIQKPGSLHIAACRECSDGDKKELVIMEWEGDGN